MTRTQTRVMSLDAMRDQGFDVADTSGIPVTEEGPGDPFDEALFEQFDDAPFDRRQTLRAVDFGIDYSPIADVQVFVNLGTLTPDEREAMRLTMGEGLSQVRAAHAAEVDQATISRRVANAWRKLREATTVCRAPADTNYRGTPRAADVYAWNEPLPENDAYVIAGPVTVRDREGNILRVEPPYTRAGLAKARRRVRQPRSAEDKRLESADAWAKIRQLYFASYGYNPQAVW